MDPCINFSNIYDEYGQDGFNSLTPAFSICRAYTL